MIVSGAPGAGKSSALMALSDALIDDELPHACGDVDELAWAYPWPDLARRTEHLRRWRESHSDRELLLVAEVVESAAHREQLLAALGAEDHLLVCLEAPAATLRARITAREPPGWSGLERLVGEAEPLQEALAGLDGVHLRLDSERLAPAEISDRIRSARPDILRAAGDRA